MSVSLPSLWALRGGGQAPWAWFQKLARRAALATFPGTLASQGQVVVGGGAAAVPGG